MFDSHMLRLMLHTFIFFIGRICCTQFHWISTAVNNFNYVFNVESEYIKKIYIYYQHYIHYIV